MNTNVPIFFAGVLFFVGAVHALEAEQIWLATAYVFIGMANISFSMVS